MERKRFKEVLKLREISGKDFADSIGLSYGSYRVAMSRGNCPKWVLAFLKGCDSVDIAGDVLYKGNGITVCYVDKKEFEKVATVYAPELKDGFDWKERLKEQQKEGGK